MTVIVSVKPRHCLFGVGQPLWTWVHVIGCGARIDGRPCFQWLLVKGQKIALTAEPFRADWPEHAAFAYLLLIYPAQRIDAGIQPIEATGDFACFHERFRQSRIVISKNGFKPCPVGSG